MDRRIGGYGGSGGRGRAAARRAALLLGAALLVAAPSPGAATAQERSAAERCRCVDADGNEIENCTCIVRPDVDVLRRLWVPGMPNPARIGVTVSGQQDATSDRDGARVQEVLEDGPADEAGLREGDVIVRVDGRSLFEPLDDPEDEQRLDLEQSVPVQRLLALLGDLEPGDEVELEYLRNGETRRTVVEAERNPARFGQAFTLRGDGPTVRLEGPDVRGFVLPRGGRALRYSFPEGMSDFQVDTVRAPGGDHFRELVVGRMDPCFSEGSGSSGSVFVLGGNCVDGLELTTLNPALGEYFGTERGVLVTDVREGTTLGIQPGDVLLAVDGREVESVSHARRILQSYEPDEELTLRVVRQGETIEISGRRR